MGDAKSFCEVTKKVVYHGVFDRFISKDALISPIFQCLIHVISRLKRKETEEIDDCHPFSIRHVAGITNTSAVLIHVAVGAYLTHTPTVFVDVAIGAHLAYTPSFLVDIAVRAYLALACAVDIDVAAGAQLTHATAVDIYITIGAYLSLTSAIEIKIHITLCVLGCTS